MCRVPMPGEPVHWQADVVPVPAFSEDEARLQRSLSLVMGPGREVLHVEESRGERLQDRPAAAAAAIERAVTAAAFRTGAYPDVVEVAEGCVADCLAPLLEKRDMRVETGLLYFLWEACDYLQRHLLARQAPAELTPRPESWLALGLDRARLARFFNAAASVHRAAPWEVLPVARRLKIRPASELDAWEVEVRRAGRRLRRIRLCGPQEYDWNGEVRLGAVVLDVAFRPPSALTKSMCIQMERKGWALADTRAFPFVVLQEAPMGALPGAIATRVTTVLRVFAAFVEANRSRLASGNGGRPFVWWDGEADATVEYTPDAPLLWPQPDRLEPSLAEGPHAEPGALLASPRDVEGVADEADAIVARFRDHLRTERDAPGAVRLHAPQARLFARFLAKKRLVPLTAASELDLRLFLYEWLPMREPEQKVRDAMFESLRRFFAYLAAEEGIVYPWAATILEDELSFSLRAERAPWEEEGGAPMSVRISWEQDLLDDLHRRVLIPDTRLRTVRGRLRTGLPGRLRTPLHRRWLLWRDELVRAGVSDAERLRALLEAKRSAWRARQRGTPAKSRAGKAFPARPSPSREDDMAVPEATGATPEPARVDP